MTNVRVPCPKCGVLKDVVRENDTETSVTFHFQDAPDDMIEFVNYKAPHTCNNCQVKFWVKKFPDVCRSMEWTPECELEQERWGSI